MSLQTLSCVLLLGLNIANVSYDAIWNELFPSEPYLGAYGVKFDRK